MFGRTRTRRRPEEERDALRRIVAAAAADDEAPSVPPPYFAARARARARAGGPALTASPLGAAAWRMLPIFGAVALAVAGLTGYESWQVSSAREAALARMLAGQGSGDLVVAALMLGADDDVESAQ
jgi:hypothetical protein